MKTVMIGRLCKIPYRDNFLLLCKKIEVMQNKIMLFSPFIFPELISTGKYNTYLVKALAQYGYTVEVVASYPLYPEWKPKKTDMALENVKIHRGGLLNYPKSIELRRMQLELGFMFHAVVQLIKNRKQDIVIPVFPPMLFFLLIAFLLPKASKKIGIVHDVQGIMAGVTKSSAKSWLIKFIRFFEKIIFKRCDKLIFVSNSMAEISLAHYDLDPEKIYVSYPFANIDIGTKTKDLESFFPGDKKHIVYSGALGEKQNPYDLLELFLSFVKNRSDVMCHIFSRGPLFERLKILKNKGSDRIRFHDLVPEENLYELYFNSNIQIIPQKPGTSDGAIPSKLPNIIAAGTPVFFIGDPDSDLADLIAQSGIGYSAKSWDLNVLNKELNDFLDLSLLSSHDERQLFVRNFVKENFGMGKLIQMIVE